VKSCVFLTLLYELTPRISRLLQENYVEVTHPSYAEPHKIRVVGWIPAGDPIALVVVSHGLHEHALRYYRIAHALTRHGIAVYACDHYAHGKSSGTRGFIPDYNFLVNDFIGVARWARSQYPGLPLSVLAHSMGTLVAALSIAEIGDVSSVLFSATPLFPGPDSSSPFGIRALFPITQTSFAASLVETMAKVDPMGPAAPIYLSGITSDPAEQAIMLRDPFRYDADIRNKTGWEVTKMIAATKKTLSSLQLPFLVMHGVDDSIALSEGSRYIYDAMKTPLQNKDIRLFSGCRHEMFHEVPEKREECINFAVSFFFKTLVSKQK
jgi:acylglycerol lipase